MSAFQGRVGFVQRVLAPYRVPFLDRLAAECEGGLEVFAGRPRPDEGVMVDESLETARFTPGRNVHLGYGKLYFWWQRGLMDWLRRFQPDVLVVPATPRMLNAFAVTRLMHQWNRPVIGAGLGMLEWRNAPRPVSAARALVLRRFYRWFDATIAYGSKSARDYVAAGVPEDKVFIAYNATDDSESARWMIELGSDLHWVPEWRQQTGFDPDLPTLLYVGRMVPVKRFDLLLEAWEPFSERSQLLVVGDGPLRAGYEAATHTLGPRISFVGYQTGEELARCFLASDVLVLPGTGGLVMHQAMSYGKPIIASLGGGDWTEADLVREGENGLLFEHGDAATLRHAIERLLFDPTLVTQMGGASRRIVRDEINIDRLVESYLNAFRTVSEAPRVA